MSVGLYQQMEKWGWGSPAGSMDPFTATTRFLEVMLRDAADWFAMDEPVVCQRVQRSQFDGVTINPSTGKPYILAQNYRDREAQTNALASDLLYFTHGGK